MDVKEIVPHVQEGSSSEENVDLAEFEALPKEKKGTQDDQKQMWRMGKVQEMRRNFRFLSMFGFSMILMATWEVGLGVSTIGLLNGGTAGLIWMFFIVWMGFLCVNTSMAEMGSMAPTSGGQYHWVSEFAPREHQKFLSYLIGWLCVLAWQASAAATSFMAGTMIQGLIALNYPSYIDEAKPWHGTLLVFAVAGFAVIFNTFLAKKLPLIEGIVLVVHIFGFFAILVPLWVLGPRGDPKEVFTKFESVTGWSTGAGTLVGMLGAILPLLGGDAAVHLSEELRNASRSLPKVMIWSTFLNGLMGWIMLITLAFTLGDIFAAIDSPYAGYAYIYVFYNATQSVAGTTAMCSLVIFMSIFCNLSIVATASRQLFAFARDQGVPFSKTLSYVPPGWDVPVPAIVVSFVVSCLLALINIGSSVAFNTINSISLAALLSSYIVSISCVAIRRFRNEPLLPTQFSLGKLGLPLNIISIVFLLFIYVISFFPTGTNPSPKDFNWSVLVYGVAIAFCLGYYFVKGRRVYVGPVEYVRKTA